MAVSGISSRSIYGNRNVITGLASGMDTEGMIENAISAYKNKITALSQKRTKTEWKQEAYRSIINKMSSFADKYTSYRSSNNLMSASFFDQAVKTVAKGKYADKVSAVGRASSNIQVNRVRQLATAATYKLSGTVLDSQTSDFGSGSVSAAAPGTLDLDKEIDVSNLSGSLTLSYGGSSALSRLTINFDETQVFADDGRGVKDGKTGIEKLADEINKQLESQSVSIGSKTYTGKELLDNVIKAEVKDGKITFTDPKKNGVYVSDATGTVQEKLLGGKEVSSIPGEQIKELTLSADALETTKVGTFDYLSSRGASMEITLDGVTKTVKLPGKGDIASGLTGKDRDKAYIDAFQKNIDSAFGAGKFTVSDKNAGVDGKGIQLEFTAAQKGSTFSVKSSKGEILGLGDSKQVTSYLNTGKTLGELLGEDGFSGFEKAYVEKKDANGKVIRELAKDANGKQLYSFKVNGKEIGQFNEDTTLNTVFNTMSNSDDSDVKVGYSKLTNELTFTAKDTGVAGEIKFSGLSAALFKTEDASKAASGYTAGQDAIFEVSVNGTSLGEITRSSNSVEMDGMTINLKGTFGYKTDENGNIEYETEQAKDKDGNLLFSIQGKQVSAKAEGDKLAFTDEKTGKTIYGIMGEDGKLTFTNPNQGDAQVYAQIDGSGRLRFTADETQGQEMKAVMNSLAIKDTNAEAVTFETSSDADKIVDAVKAMVNDYNEMVKEIKSAYSTLPAQQSNGAYYEPLTAEEEEEATESFIKNWTEKAKQGILFGDRDLASLYQRLTSAVSLTGENGAALRAAGITVNYSNGLSTIDFDEDKFRTALNNDPDKVRDAFTASTEAGSKSNGLMQALKQPLDMYGKTSGGKGILVEKAGSPLAPSTMYTNTIQKELDRIDEQIERWQDKMTDQVDYYTSQFSRLEQLVQQMNSQSSYFSQLMGG
ncbi:MAG: flagellar filament capping protein FliD [Dysosmobacter sp.]|nr:flagellar filament capping protein FliD [Dysosmobacter sp.]